jgi:predicted SnoaL-like aldol condensation-catalyzing enzyme
MTDLAANKQLVKEALELAFSPEVSFADKRIRMTRYFNPDKYIQHSAFVPDGFEGLLRLIEALGQRHARYAVNVVRLIAEDDFVFAHCHYTYGDDDPLGKAIAEVFRLEDGRLIEHWDVIQDVPAEPANGNGMF